MKLPSFKLFFKDKPKALSTGELQEQKARITTSTYQDYFRQQPTIKDLYEMRQDPVIKIGLSVIKHPLQRVDWEINALDPNQKLLSEERDLIEGNLKELWSELIVNMLTAIDFGYFICEKVWKYSNNYLIYKRFVPLRPDSTQMFYDNTTGDVTRVTQVTSIKKEPVSIPAEKLFVYTHQKEFGDPRGESRLSGVFPFWRMSDDIYKNANDYYFRYSVPLAEAWAPEGQTKVGVDEKGNDVMQDNLSYWRDVVENIHRATTITHRYSPGGEYGFQFHESKTKGVDFIPYIEHLNIMKLLALFVPELIVMQGSKGSFALGKEHTELFLDNEEALLKEMNGQIDQDLIKPVVDMNFPPTYTGREAPQAHWSYAPISKQVRSYVSKIFELITNGLANRGITHVNIKELGERLGIPILPEPEKFMGPETSTESASRETEEMESLSELSLAETTIQQARKKADKLVKDLTDEIGKIYDEQITTILLKIKELLEKDRAKVGSQMKKMRVPYEGRLSSELFTNSLKAFEIGKKSASEELKIDSDSVIPDRIRNSLRARADAVADRHANDLLYLTQITVLDQLYENVTDKDIIIMLTEEFDKFKNKKIGATATTEIMNAFNLGRSYVADQHIIK